MKRCLGISVALVIVLMTTSAWANVLTVQQMAEDIEYVADLITRVHPDPFHASSKEEFDRLVTDLLEETGVEMERDDFFYVLNKLPVFVQDGHTQIFHSAEKTRLPVRMRWATDGLVITHVQDGYGLKFGDEVLEIGGLPVSEILQRLAPIIPAENSHGLRVTAGSRLASGTLLSYLGLLPPDEPVHLLVEDVAGNRRRVEVGLIPAAQWPPEPVKDFVKWNIDVSRSLGYFYLHTCNANDEYTNALAQFFSEVADNRIAHVVLDVRENSGGDSRVIDEFLKYLPVTKVKGFSSEIKYSPEAQEKRGYPKRTGVRRPSFFTRLFGGYNFTIPKLEQEDLRFHGDVFVLTSPITFSSANWFAAVFQDNELALVVGEPTGNAPSSFGDIISFTTPNSRFPMIISHKRWVRPNPKRDPSDAIYPDLEMPTTVADIRAGRDAQLEGLYRYLETR